jgi:hypothetical protein
LGRVETAQRHAEERTHRGAQRLRPGRIRAAGRERDAGAERVRGAEQRSDVPWVGDVPERERRSAHAARQVVAPVHADDTRRMRKARDVRQELRRHRLAPAAEGGKYRPSGGGFAAAASGRDEQLDRLEAGSCGRLDQVLTLRDEQPELVAPAPVAKLTDELEPLVVA